VLSDQTIEKMGSPPTPAELAFQDMFVPEIL
jgi:hypothetical protein